MAPGSGSEEGKPLHEAEDQCLHLRPGRLPILGRSGGVWLDNGDPDNTSTDFNGTSTHVEGIENDCKGPDSENNDYNNNIFVSTNDHFNTNRDTQHPDDKGVHACFRVCEPEVVEGNLPDPANIIGNDEQASYNAPIALQSPLQKQLAFSGSGQAARSRPDPTPRINPRDYKPLDVPDHPFCRACGSPWTHHVEKLTAERRARLKEER